MNKPSLDHSWKSFAIFGYLWKSLVSFGIFWEMTGIICFRPSEIFLRIFRNFSESGQKSSENCQKTMSLVCSRNKIIHGCLQVDMEFLFMCSSWHITLSWSHSWQRYWVKQSKRNSISMCTLVLFSINLTNSSKLTPSLKQISHGLIKTFDCNSR